MTNKTDNPTSEIVNPAYSLVVTALRVIERGHTDDGNYMGREAMRRLAYVVLRDLAKYQGINLTDTNL